MTNPNPKKPVENASSVRVASRLSLAALILGVLAVPAGLMPLLGIGIALVALLVSIIAVIKANRKNEAVGQPVTGLVLAIIAMALALITTKSALDFPEECKNLQGDELSACVKEHRGT